VQRPQTSPQPCDIASSAPQPSSQPCEPVLLPCEVVLLPCEVASLRCDDASQPWTSTFSRPRLASPRTGDTRQPSWLRPVTPPPPP
jgi:hypothetical protein